MFGLTWPYWLGLAVAVLLPHVIFLCVLKLALVRATASSGTETDGLLWARLKERLLLPGSIWGVTLGLISAPALLFNCYAGSAEVKLGPMPPIAIACGIFFCAFPGQMLAAAIAFRSAVRSRRVLTPRALLGAIGVLFTYPWLLVFPAVWCYRFSDYASDDYGRLHANWGEGGQAVAVMLAFCAFILWLAVLQGWLVAEPIRKCLRKPGVVEGMEQKKSTGASGVSQSK